jgi:hypothetical protein
MVLVHEAGDGGDMAEGALQHAAIEEPFLKLIAKDVRRQAPVL